MCVWDKPSTQAFLCRRTTLHPAFSSLGRHLYYNNLPPGYVRYITFLSSQKRLREGDFAIDSAEMLCRTLLYYFWFSSCPSSTTTGKEGCSIKFSINCPFHEWEVVDMALLLYNGFIIFGTPENRKTIKKTLLLLQVTEVSWRIYCCK